jgi:hypothetical protein
MFVELTVPLASPAKSHEVGEVWEVSDEEGHRMIAAEVAKPATNSPENPEAKLKAAKREKR